MNPESPERRESIIETEKNVKDFELLTEAFESEHDMEALYAIETKEQAINSEDREAAKADLPEIVRLLKALRFDGNLSSKKRDEIKDAYRNISRAVGMINSGRVDHTRG